MDFLNFFRDPEKKKKKDVPMDPAGQPPLALNVEIRVARDMSEIVGVLRGVIADGVISENGVVFLGRWLAVNRSAEGMWPLTELAPLVRGALSSRTITADSRRIISEVIVRIVSSGKPEILANTPTALPYTVPAPEIVFAGREFVLTGMFNFNTRNACQAEIVARGGSCAKHVTLRTHYLVIGEYSSRDWITTAWGRKIEKALEYAERGQIAIVSEEHWANAVKRTATGGTE